MAAPKKKPRERQQHRHRGANHPGVTASDTITNLSRSHHHQPFMFTSSPTFHIITTFCIIHILSEIPHHPDGVTTPPAP
jgi:hypothetical protein